jgi:hypothetical protein
MTKLIKPKLLKILKRILFVSILIFLATFLQVYWAIGTLSSKMSSGCLDCSFFDDTFMASLLTSFFLTILFNLFFVIKNKCIKISIQFLLLASVWLFWNYTIFVDRESSWSTYQFNEEMHYTISISLLPLLVLTFATLFIINFKFLVKKNNTEIKKAIPLLILSLLLQSCVKNKNEKQDGLDIKRIEKQNISKSNTIKDTVKNIIQPVKSNNLLFDITGNYTFKDDVTDCEIFLSLFYKNGDLKYTIKTNTRKLTGDTTIDLNEKKDVYYITFKNIEWSENIGAIDPEGEASEENLLLPQDIQGVLYKNEITIQNNGNAMNYYVKLGECDVKYIVLIK